MSCNCSTTPSNAKCINTCPCICDIKIESAKTFDASSFYNQLQSDSRKSVRTYTDEIKKKLVGAAREGKDRIKIDSKRFPSHELAMALGAGLFGIKDNFVTTCLDTVIFGEEEFDISNEKQFVEEMKCALDLHLTKILNIMRENSKRGWFSCEIFTDFPNFIRQTLGKKFGYGAYSSTFNTLLISW